MTEHKVTIICPVYNEERYIGACIESIIVQDYPKDAMEVLFVDGKSKDKTAEIINNYSNSYHFIKLLNNPNRTVPYAMNIGIKESVGDVIIRIDAHAEYATNYISSLVKALYELNCENVGAPWRTDVINKTPKTLAIREVLCNRFGVGNAAFRVGITEAKEVDTVPFGCWKREVFNKYGLYDTRLTRNQDIELNKRIINGGGHIYIIPHTYSTYYARETFSAIAKNNYQNGMWNILTVYYTKQFKSLSIRHFIPFIFLMSLIVPVLLSWLYIWILAVSITSLLSYLTLIVSISILLGIKKGLSIVNLIKSFITLHLSYGYGSIVGISKIIIRKV